MDGKSTVLIVDDEIINRIILRKILKNQYEILEAVNGEEALQILKEKHYMISAIILDVLMPIKNGIDFLNVYHQSEAYENVPVLVATVEGNVHVEKECLELGAWDFVGKPYDADVLRFRLANVIKRSQLQVGKVLKYMQDFDVLTGIYNKNKFFCATRELLDQEPKKKYALIRMDIEKFQLINSFYGIEEGDRLLKYIAKLMIESALKFKMTYGRMEADIFCFCVPYGKKQDLVDIVTEYRRVLGLYNLEFDIVPVCGIYLIADKEMPINLMYDKANLAAKDSKDNYICNYTFYSEKMSTGIIREQIIVNNMKNALEIDKFVLYIQPQFALESSTIDGGEVLIRWNDPHKGIISPEDFIPILERNGFIIWLDYFVWEATCKLLKRWIQEGKDPHPLSVNLSMVSLYNPRLVETICRLVEQYQIPPKLLQLELTESAYTSNPRAIQKMMERLQKKGFTILIDDFRSGYYFGRPMTIEEYEELAYVNNDVNQLADSGRM